MTTPRRRRSITPVLKGAGLLEEKATSPSGKYTTPLTNTKPSSKEPTGDYPAVEPRALDSKLDEIFPDEGVPVQREPVVAKVVQSRYYVIPVTEQKDASWGEIELADPNAKFNVPAESWGYQVIRKEVLTGEYGEVILKPVPGFLQRVYFGVEHKRKDLDKNVELYEEQLKGLNSQKSLLEEQIKGIGLAIKTDKNLKEFMFKSDLERFVELEAGKRLGIKDPKVKVVRR